jgi:hypothetical protein
MGGVFPFDMPGPTLLYLLLYVLTLAVHFVFMNYVFAGTLYIATIGWGRPDAALARLHNPIAGMLRDWLPFAFSGVITAGVAPLLFLQVLYKQPFYTANLLLFHRWMAVVPALIAAFYLLYLLKSKSLVERPVGWQVAVSMGALLAIGFTGYSWSENHLLSLDQRQWVPFFAERRWFYHHAAILPRVGMWLAGAVPTMMAIVCWQLRSAERRGLKLSSSEVRVACAWALAGLGLAAIFGTMQQLRLGTAMHVAFGDRASAPYAVVALVGVGLQGVGWMKQWLGARLSRGWLLLASVGAMLSILSMCMVREADRFASIDVAALSESHAAAAQNGGRLLFLLFFAINATIITWCVLAVRRDLKLDRAASTLSP